MDGLHGIEGGTDWNAREVDVIATTITAGDLGVWCSHRRICNISWEPGRNMSFGEQGR